MRCIRIPEHDRHLGFATASVLAYGYTSETCHEELPIYTMQLDDLP